MKVYRIERRKYIDSTLTGRGAAKSEGNRWNSLETYMVYTAESRALAMLEVAVHLDLSEDLPNDRYLIQIEIPDDIQILTLDISQLPKNWDAIPPIQATQYIGDDFILGNSAAVLRVPSSIIPDEFNYLINPRHSESSRVQVISTRPFQFDSRLISIPIKETEKLDP